MFRKKKKEKKSEKVKQILHILQCLLQNEIIYLSLIEACDLLICVSKFTESRMITNLSFIMQQKVINATVQSRI